MENRTRPNDPQAEKLVLGAIMNSRNAFNEVREILTPETFYNDFHKEIFRCIMHLEEKGESPDIVTVTNEMVKRGYAEKLYEIAEIAGHNSFDVYQHAAIIHDKHKRRQFYEIGHFLLSNSYSEEIDIVDVLEETKSKLDGVFQDSQSNIADINEALTGVYKQINLNIQGGTELTGDRTGFEKFDKKTGGLQKSDLIIIAADTSTGKTSLAINMVLNCGAPVAFYSMEMKKEQIAARMTAIQSGVPANEIQYSRLTDSQIKSVDRGISALVGKPVYFDDRSTSSIEMILASIRIMKIKYGIHGAVVDYLQILNVNMKSANKEQQMGDVARRLKNLAKELDIWIIAVSQLNRDHQNPVPSLSRLRDSGQIAEAADVVILIYRPEIYNKIYPDPFRSVSPKRTAMIDVAKGRNIGLLKFICGFKPETTHFYNLDSLPTIQEGESEEAPF